MTEVFISYSRKDKAFVQRLHDALKAHDRDTWVDWEGIPLTADWWQEIQRGIEGAQTFAFVLSPDSVASKVCRDEIDHAIANNKRLVPIVHREGFELDKTISAHEAINRHNWLFFREQDDFAIGFQGLLTAIDTDLEHVRAHTRLLERAIEWNAKARNPCLLMRGDDLEEAEHWLAQGGSKEPRPTELQGEYISISRKTETARQKVDRRKQQWFTAGISAFAFLAVGAAGVAGFERQIAEKGRQNAELTAQSLNALNMSASNLQLDALIESLKAGHNLKQWEKDVERGTAIRVTASLEQEVYQINERNRLEGHSSNIWAISFSPDGKTIATGSADHTVRLWDLQGRALHTLKGHTADVQSVSFSPDGKTLVTGSKDGTAKLWDLRGHVLQTLKVDNSASGVQQGVWGVSFSPDGKIIATGSADHMVKLWNLQGHALKTF